MADCNCDKEIMTACSRVIECIPRVAQGAAHAAIAGLGATYAAAGGPGRPSLEETLGAWGLCLSDVEVQRNWMWPITLSFDAVSTRAEFEDSTPNWFLPRGSWTQAPRNAVLIEAIRIDETGFAPPGVPLDIYNTDDLLRGLETDIVSPNRSMQVVMERTIPGPFDVTIVIVGDKVKVDPAALARRNSGMCAPPPGPRAAALHMG